MIPVARPSSFSFWTILALVGIIALAAGLRLVQIDRLPPGLSYDEAWNDLEALRIVQRGVHPVYIVDERGEGEEPLHIYLIAALFTVTGPIAIGGRVVSALVGTLTILFVFLCAREMLRGTKGATAQRSTVVALMAALVLATLYWHVHYTRLGMEPPTVPAMATLTFWLLWRAFHRGDWLAYALAGAALGVSLYTHISARFLPVVVVLFAAWRWSMDRKLLRQESPRLGLLVASAVIVFAPLGLFFVQNPDLFFFRAEQTSAVAVGGDLHQTLNNVVKVVGGLTWQGDTNLRLNLPGRPALDVVQLLLFVVGAVYALGRERRRVLIFPLLWAGIMVLPSVFSDAAPHFGRMLGATPALAIVVAFGLGQISNLRFRIPNVKRAIPVGLIVALGAVGYSIVTMARDYFVTWARDPGLFTAFDVGLRQSAEYLASLPYDELLSLSPDDRDLPIFHFAFRDDVSRLKTFNGRRCVVYPVQSEQDFTHVAIVAEESDSLQTLQRVFPSGQVVKTFKSLGSPYAVAFHVNKDTVAQVPPAEQAVFLSSGKEIVLVRASYPSDKVVRVGSTLPVTVSWESHQTLDTNLTVFVHLAASLGTPPIAQEDAQPCDNSYPTTWWTPGEIIEEYHRLVVSATIVPGQYVLTTGLYDLATGKRLPMCAEPPAGQLGPDCAAGDQFVLGAVTIAP